MYIYDEISKIEDCKNSKIIKCENPYALFLEQKTGHSAYFFSCPIYDREGKWIDPTFYRDDSVFRLKGSSGEIVIDGELIKFYKDNTVISVKTQKELTIEPTFNGIKGECEGEVCRIFLHTEERYEEKFNGRCFVLWTEENAGVLSVSGLYSVAKNGLKNVEISYQKVPNGYEIEIKGTKDALRVAFEISLYASKLIFDTTIESDFPDRNNAYGGVAYLVNGEKKEELYSRFNLGCLSDLSKEKFERATLYIPVYSKGKSKLQLRAASEPWCSLGLNWMKRIEGGEALKESIVENGYAKFDITRLLKQQLRTANIANYGIIISTDENTPVVISTGDNYDRPQILRIQF